MTRPRVDWLVVSLTLLVFTAFGGFLVIAGLARSTWEQAIAQGPAVPARITAIRYGKSVHPGIVVDFTTVDNQPVPGVLVIDWPFGPGSPNPVEGQSITVTYNPNNPRDGVHYTGAKSPSENVTGLIGLGVGLVVLGPVVAVVHQYRRRRRKPVRPPNHRPPGNFLPGGRPS